MFSPEENQISICLLKSNLEDIENNLVEQRSAWPELDAENEQKCRDSMNALRVARALNSELEKLNHENVKLMAKRMQLKRQSDELGRALDKALQYRAAIEDELKFEEQKIETQVKKTLEQSSENKGVESPLDFGDNKMSTINFFEGRKYEDLLSEKAERFRKTRGCYNEAEMTGDIAKVNCEISKLEDLVNSRRGAVEQLRKHLDELKPTVSEDLLNLIGRNDINEKLKTLTENCALLQQKRNNLHK